MCVYNTRANCSSGDVGGMMMRTLHRRLYTDIVVHTPAVLPVAATATCATSDGKIICVCELIYIQKTTDQRSSTEKKGDGRNRSTPLRLNCIIVVVVVIVVILLLCSPCVRSCACTIAQPPIIIFTRRTCDTRVCDATTLYTILCRRTGTAGTDHAPATGATWSFSSDGRSAVRSPARHCTVTSPPLTPGVRDTTSTIRVLCWSSRTSDDVRTTVVITYQYCNILLISWQVITIIYLYDLITGRRSQLRYKNDSDGIMFQIN